MCHNTYWKLSLYGLLYQVHFSLVFQWLTPGRSTGPPLQVEARPPPPAMAKNQRKRIPLPLISLWPQNQPHHHLPLNPLQIRACLSTHHQRFVILLITNWVQLGQKPAVDSILLSHCVDIWNCRYLDFYQGPMTVYLHVYSTNFVSQFLLWSSIRTCLQSPHYENNHYIFLCCECQSLSMPNKACPKVQSLLGFFGSFFIGF